MKNSNTRMRAGKDSNPNNTNSIPDTNSVTVRVETVPIDSVRLNPNNPRTITEHKQALLNKSLAEFPDMLKIREVVVDETMTVLGGNRRLLGLQAAGETQITVKIVEGLTPAQKREFQIKDNNEFGEWDMDALIAEYSLKNLVDWGVDLHADDLEGLLGAKESKGSDKSLPEDTAYEVIVECDSEQEMAETYDKLREEGYQCRLSIF